MILPSDDFEYLLHLADEIELGDELEKYAPEFKQLAEMLKKRVYRYCKNPDILEMVNRLPNIELQAHRRSFFEQLLPKSSRNMVGSYKIKEAIRTQVRETVSRFKEIKRWLGEG